MPAGGTPPAALTVTGMSKSFPGVHALAGVDFTLAAGEVHGLVGQNGAGKSTLVKIITGAQAPDEGTLLVHGRPLDHWSPRAHMDAGIAAIYQELNTVPARTAMDNVFLGQYPRVAGFVRRGEMRRRFRELAALVGAEEISPDAVAGLLSIANQQLLEIMRALVAERTILIMDEPTASLGPSERERLKEIVRTLRERGVSVIYISHDLDEVLEIAQTVTVMRDGRVVETRPAAGYRAADLVHAMLGEVPDAAHAGAHVPPSADAPEVLRATGVTLPGAVHGIDLTLRRGEILGVAGLVGAGRTELLRCLAGAEKGARGELMIEGMPRRWPRSVAAAVRMGIALAPEDRKGQGLVLIQNGSVNVTLPDIAAASTAGIVSSRRRRELAGAAVTPVGFDPARLSAPAGTLSGGNQQKLVIGKWLHRRPRVLLLDEPTRGIDVGAKAEIYAVMRRLADEGMSVIVVSSDLDEVVDLADRVLVMHAGRKLAELSGAEATVKRVLDLVFKVEEVAA